MVCQNVTALTVCVVGLGYVGYPLAEAFSSHLRTLGYDIDPAKLERIRQTPGNRIEVTDDPARIREADVVIIAVPTPVTRAKDPDLGPVASAAATIGRNLKPGAVVVLESTVYPGVTEELMAPVLEAESGLVCGTDFFDRVLPRADQPRRRRARAPPDRQDRGGDGRGDDGSPHLALQPGHDGPPRPVHPDGRGREGDREHPARPEHRAHERALPDLPADGPRHPGRPRGRRHQVELPPLPSRAGRAATASPSTRTTSCTRPRSSGTTPR